MASSEKINTPCRKTLKTQMRFLQTVHEHKCLPPTPGTGEIKILLHRSQSGITGGNVVTCACQGPASNLTANNGFPLPQVSFRSSPKNIISATLKYVNSTLHELGRDNCMYENPLSFL